MGRPAASVTRRPEIPELHAFHRGLRARSHAEFCHDARDVTFDGALGRAERGGQRIEGLPGQGSQRAVEISTFWGAGPMTKEPIADWAAARSDTWRRHLGGLEAMLAPIDKPLIKALALTTPVRIADVGCASGATTMAAWRRAPAAIVPMESLATRTQRAPHERALKAGESVHERGQDIAGVVASSLSATVRRHDSRARPNLLACSRRPV